MNKTVIKQPHQYGWNRREPVLDKHRPGLRDNLKGRGLS